MKAGVIGRNGPGLLAVLLLTGALGALPARAQAPPSEKRLVLNDVHTDAVDVRFEAGQLRLQTRIGEPPYEYAAADEVIFQLKDVPESALEVPDDPAFAFLGDAGDPIWIAPQTQDPALLFAGWDTQGLTTGVFAGDAVELELVSVTGPGRLEVFQTGDFGEVVRVFSGTDPAHKTLTMPVHTHAHGNWVFTALGRYELTFRARATLAGGGAVVSAPTTYTWVVGDVIPVDSAVSLAATQAQPGVTLTATVQPGHAPGWVSFREGSTELGFAAVSGGNATFTTSALAPGEHQLTAHFIPKYDNDFAPSVSAPVTVVVSGPPASPTPTASPSASPTPSPSTSPSPSTTNAAPVTTTPACVPGVSYVPVLSDGHVDVATRVVNGRLDLVVKDGTKAGTTSWRDPGDVVLHVKPQAAASVPSGPFGFLGSPGSTIWQIPQTQRSGVLWLGWNTEAVSSAVSWSLTKVSGPGRAVIYEYATFGQPRVLFNSGDGLPDQYTIGAGTHAHGNWAFTKQGVYRLTFTQRATLSGGQSSDTEVVTVVVGSTDPKPVAKRTSGCGLASTGDSITGIAIVGGGFLLGGMALVGLSLWRRRKAVA